MENPTSTTSRQPVSGRGMKNTAGSAALRAMLAVAALAALLLAWRYASGPARSDGPPSVRVIKLLPGTFVWADAPADADVAVVVNPNNPTGRLLARGVRAWRERRAGMIALSSAHRLRICDHAALKLAAGLEGELRPGPSFGRSDAVLAAA